MTPIENFLVAHGLDVLSGAIWGKFLHAVFEALRAAEMMVRSPEYWNEYRQKEGAFLKPGKGVHAKQRLPAEEGLTHALYECLWTIKSRTDLNHPLRNLAIEFHSEARMPSRIRAGKRARRTDIWARSCKSENGPDIVFEAKLVRDDQEIDKRYLGIDGLGCFLGPDEPYTIGPVGGLCAYTIDGTATKWANRIVAVMNARPAAAISQHWVSIGNPAEAVLCSRVARPLLSLDPIAIVHVIMRLMRNLLSSTHFR